MGNGGRIINVVYGQQKPHNGSTLKSPTVSIFVLQVENNYLHGCLMTEFFPSTFTPDALVQLMFCLLH